MTNEEFDKLCEEMRAQGAEDKDILEALLQMFKDGKLSVDDLRKLSGALGYELTEKFQELTEGMDKMPTKDSEVDEQGGDISEEEVEEAQEYKPDDEESDEEEEESEYESEEEDEESDDDEEEDEEEEESEEDEKEKVRKWYD